jgi:hypothetical protein
MKMFLPSLPGRANEVNHWEDLDSVWRRKREIIHNTLY